MKTVSLIFPIGGEYGGQLAEGAISYAEKLPHLRVIEMPYRGGKKPHAVGRLHADGALFYAEAEEKWVPSLSDQFRTISCGGGWDKHGIPIVAYAGKNVVRAAVEHALALKRPSVAYVAHRISDDPALTRHWHAFKNGVEECGCTASCFSTCGIHPSLQPERLALLEKECGLAAFLLQLPKPATIWCEEDHLAAMVCGAADLVGLKVPRDLAVFGLGDYRIARQTVPPITSIPMSGQKIGFEAMRLMDRWLAGHGAPPPFTELAPPPLVERESTGAMPGFTSAMQRARAYINAHACEGVTVKEVAAACDVSPETLIRKYARSYGRTPGVEIRDMRLGRAKELLRTTHLSLTRIGQMIGFDRHVKFFIFFKRQTGSAPGAFRKKVQLVESKKQVAPSAKNNHIRSQRDH